MIPALDHIPAPPAHWSVIRTLDMHTGGEPLRIIIDGLPRIEGRTVLEKRRYFRQHCDRVRTRVILEPRGHADMYGAVVTPSADADLDVFFLHNEGYSTMCGHAVIALTTLIGGSRAAQIGNGTTKITMNVPAGRIDARAVIQDGEVREVSFRNVASFLYLKDEEVDVPGLGLVRFDVAYGGAFYAVVEAAPLGLAMTGQEYARLIDYGQRIKRAVMDRHAITHPFEPDLSFLYGTIFTGPSHVSGMHSRNVCVFADGEVDRSPTGSGVSARAALLDAKGELPLNEWITVESIVGSTMTVRAVERLAFGPYAAIVPEVGGTAFLTGRSEFWFDPADPLRDGFFLR